MDNQTSTPTPIPSTAPNVVQPASSVVSVPPVPALSAVPPVPPVPPKVVAAPVTDSPKNSLHILLPALLLVLILAAGYFWYSSRSVAETVSKAPLPYVPLAAESATVTTPGTYLAESAIPQGFPNTLPVEKEALVSVGKIDYGENVTQYMVSYSSSKTKEALWKIYTDYFTAGGYALNASSTNKLQGVMDAKKGKSEVNVLITSVATSSLVHITVVER